MVIKTLNDISKTNELEHHDTIEEEPYEDVCRRIQKLFPHQNDEPVVYWEVQGKDGMCALHTLNCFLQGPVYSEGDLSGVALALDEKERRLLHATGTHEAHSEDIKALIQGGSTNVSEDGFFSYAVIEECLRIQGYRLAFYKCSGIMDEILPINGNTWYNLDSMKKYPNQLTVHQVRELLDTSLDQHKTSFVISSMYGKRELPENNASSCDGLNRNQFFLTKKQIEQLIHFSSSTSQDKVLDRHIFPSTVGKKSPFLEDITPSASTTTKNSVTSTHDASNEMDPELLKAIELSLEGYYNELPYAPIPPDTSAKDEDVFLFRVRLPNGIILSRRFWKTDKVISLCHWIEREKSMQTSTQICYILIATFPRREFRRFDPTNVLYSLREHQEETTFKNVSNEPLGEIFTSSECLTLQFIVSSN
ncbi:ataxin-3-like isoform X2 [Hylaeus volcanicus]|uniref:ataxin-3-like isoform X2 n=1 Tax=Hylaeus volcanicus TaxID=313075 RepID=UPI0023B7F7C9|nr:ataxin-3-like isoform X2 [Hylaeus volcanicus]